MNPRLTQENITGDCIAVNLSYVYEWVEIIRITHTYTQNIPTSPYFKINTQNH